jgi:excinuclease ABC subunit C
MQLPETVKAKLKDLPDKPGCYLMRDRNGRIIYVGKAISLRKRVQSYFRDATLKSASPKLRGLVRSVHDIDIMVVHNEAAALLTEGELIKTYRPRYNVAFKDDKRFLLLRADPRATYPRFELVRIRRDDGAIYFGPYASSNAARSTLDFVEKQFGIRKCTPVEPDANTYKHCINDIVRFCSAPCVGRIGQHDYRKQFEEACEFLRGKRPALLADIRQQMQEAAETLDFERAAGLRDTLQMLDRAIRQHARVAPTRRMQRESAMQGVEALQQQLHLESPPRIIEAFDISNISGTFAVASMVCAVDGIPTPNRYRRFRIKTVSGSNDPAMMAEVIHRRIRGLQERHQPFPDLILVDGGITQLNAARTSLANRNASQIPTAGLAKRYEQIVISEKETLALPLDSPALKVLRQLRDEAHRFAITYHRNLRNRRIRESALDRIPGIGEKRKQQLLQHFGSVRRLKAANTEAIAAMPGIGPALARLIHDELNKATNPNRR